MIVILKDSIYHLKQLASPVPCSRLEGNCEHARAVRSEGGDRDGDKDGDDMEETADINPMVDDSRCDADLHTVE